MQGTETYILIQKSYYQYDQGDWLPRNLAYVTDPWNWQGFSLTLWHCVSDEGM